jgi:hypothetical protein
MREYRRQATAAIHAQDWRAFFAAAADCARALNRRDAIVDEAAVLATSGRVPYSYDAALIGKCSTDATSVIGRLFAAGGETPASAA